MAREINRLNVKGLPGLGEGLHADGGGLYLRVEATGARRWLFLFRYRGKRCEMGLGPAGDVALGTARDMAQEARLLVKAGRNPIEERRRQLEALKAPPAMTFGEVADEAILARAPRWTNELSLHQWKRSAEIECKALRDKRPAEITTEDVLAVLKPVWVKTPETGRRLQGRMEHFFDVAKVKGLREGDNPARWDGHLSLLLPRRAASSGRNHAAVPFSETKTFFSKLRASQSITAEMLDLTILTVLRTTEVRLARGGEFDLDDAMWTVPAGRMKNRKPHRVALSAAAVAIVRRRIEACGQGLLFPGLVKGKPLSNMAMLKLMDLLGYGAYTVHGWRATFRTWGQERTNFPFELLELSLAHEVGDETVRAYNRGDGLERRRKLMEAWAQHCEPTAGKLLRIA